MAITIYTGTPGSGKSYHAALDIERWAKQGGGLICNFPVNESMIKKKKSEILYWDNSEFSVKRLLQYAKKNHKVGIENQTHIIIDEAQVLFNCRDFGRKGRDEWIKFFSLHRHFGYGIILITQNDRFLDKQIRGLIEDEVKHRKLNNYGLGGMLLTLFRQTCFIAINYWYGGNKLLIGKQTLKYKKRYAKFYDSYAMFDEMFADDEPGTLGRGAGDMGSPEETVQRSPDDLNSNEPDNMLVQSNELVRMLERAKRSCVVSPTLNKIFILFNV